jgi:AmmeMemoRadiSam system radical SAM enzyme
VEFGCRSVAFTYNDPTIFHEYAIDVAQACREGSIKSSAVTAGYVCEEPRAEFYRYMDAANVDLKGFTERFYKQVCAGSLQPVLDTLSYLKHHTRVWFEITTLLIPGETIPSTNWKSSRNGRSTSSGLMHRSTLRRSIPIGKCSRRRRRHPPPYRTHAGSP